MWSGMWDVHCWCSVLDSSLVGEVEEGGASSRRTEDPQLVRV